MRHTRKLTTALAALALGATLAGAQTPASDPSARLKAVLPPDVAARVLATIADARARDLPADALEQRALKFAAKGVAPTAIEKSVAEQAERMSRARDALTRGRRTKPAGDEVEAGAEAMRKGVDGAKVSALAQSAPSGRSLAVPLYVIGSLVDRGLPSDEALARVQARLKARVADRDLEQLPGELPDAVAGRGQGKGQGNRPAETGRELAATKRPGSAGGSSNAGNGRGGPPAGVPGNAGKNARPTTPPGQQNKPGKPTKPGKP